MIVFSTDLDNTIIYSYKHDIGPLKRNVERYQGREISFITEKTFDLLKKVSREMLIVPTSTRTVEQYSRIDLGIGKFPYALVCNGGVLLREGNRDNEWYSHSLELVKPGRPELEKSLEILKKEPSRKFELRFIEDLFVFTKCREPQKIVDKLKGALNSHLVDVFNNGEKIYVIPIPLRKGNAVRRFRKLLNPEYIIAAGDSEFDVSLVEAADKGFVPYGFKKKYCVDCDVCEMDRDRIFSESLLMECIKGNYGKDVLADEIL